MHHKNSEKKFIACCWIVLACFSVSCLLSIVKFINIKYHLPIIELVAIRNLFALIILIPFILRDKKSAFKTKRLPMHFMRAVNSFFGMAVWFMAITVVPLPMATALSFTVPLFTTIAAIIFLKERVDFKRWVAIFIGFIGMLFIIKPSQDFHLSYLIVILATIIWAISNIMIKKLTKTETPKSILYYNTAITAIISVVVALPWWKDIELSLLLWCLILGLLSIINNISLSKAYCNADVSFVQSLDFLRLIFISIIAYFAFKEVIDLYSLIGTAIIFISTVYTVKKEMLFKRKSFVL